MLNTAVAASKSSKIQETQIQILLNASFNKYKGYLTAYVLFF